MPTPAVDQSELMFRQVGPGGNPIYFDPAQKRPLHQSIFIPTRKDSDGLSLIRNRFRTEVWSAYRLEQPTIRFRLARDPFNGSGTTTKMAKLTGRRAIGIEVNPDYLPIAANRLRQEVLQFAD